MTDQLQEEDFVLGWQPPQTRPSSQLDSQRIGSKAHLETGMSYTTVPSLGPCDWLDVNLLLFDVQTSSRAFSFGLSIACRMTFKV
jgi:hypothetical protein